MLSFKITGVYKKYMILFLVSGWINKIVKHLKLKLFSLVYFFLTVKFLKNINIFFKIFSAILLYILIFFLYLIIKNYVVLNENNIKSDNNCNRFKGQHRCPLKLQVFIKIYDFYFSLTLD